MEHKKKVPNSIGIFGASGHIGGPMVRWLRYNAPDVRLRLISSGEDKLAQLRASYPDCEIAIGNYYDLPSLTAAVSGIEGLFVIAPNGTREEHAMTNLISAVRNSDSLIHMIRAVGVFPSVNPRRMPEALTNIGWGIATQHPIARRLLDESDLPVTYFNIGASFMDNFLNPRFQMLSPGKVTWPNRRVPFIDPREIGEAGARILLSDNARHLYQFHTLNNGYDNLYVGDVVRMMGEVLQTDIAYDSTKEGLIALFESAATRDRVRSDLAEYLWQFFRYEDANDVAWTLNDFLERTLGRKPTTVRAWLQEHQQQLRERLKDRRSRSPTADFVR
ncbi:NAD(P)H-binding protein [Bradyrhizobium sp. 61]|uniref:NmrA family NAD(P)-binding protein n=1 Tax=unclassified Bradyrhizobium TaxID=2631580 RepID=UPI001FF9F5FC|nr:MULTISPECIES: NAD(P)H-binding protein [unclassified Bradyrhizobium]MCK1277441.1 NAD(P)H-binding protein [Bradyrhizobium sp. 61]MCK1441887.1 NAD(P)H-binding protein [Bradyrhizobium sp. 48]MCK1465638.1 NAD(P)H-binding protein [Bradyrhizobium sp. 2]